MAKPTELQAKYFGQKRLRQQGPLLTRCGSRSSRRRLNATRPAEAGRKSLRFGRGRLLARLHTLSDRTPAAVRGFESFSSSAVTLETMRLVSTPAPFGNMPPALRTVIVLLASSIVQVPKFAVVPCTAAVFSSGVPLRRLLTLNLGTSGLTMI